MADRVIITQNVQFYIDLGNLEVERFARAICHKRGWDPDRLVPDNGYDGAPLIPLWWKFQDDTLNFIAMLEESKKTRWVRQLYRAHFREWFLRWE